MKLAVLMYLSDDDESVARMLEAQGVTEYSRLPLEGHGAGFAGWYGAVAPYASTLIFSVLPNEQAERLVQTVAACDDCEDPTHPVHALLIDIERAVVSGSTAS